MARFTVRMRKVTVGWSSLETQERDTGSARGDLRPGPAYDLVQPVFRLFAEAQGASITDAVDEAKLARYHAARDQLGLSLHAEDGAEIPTEFIHISDFTVERGAGALELEVRVTAPSAWRRLVRPPRSSPT